MVSEAGFLALRDRAYEVVLAAGEPVAEADLLAYVYGGHVPTAVYDRLLAPLLGDVRLQRLPSGQWTLAMPTTRATGEAFTALAYVATGPSPPRARLVRLVGLHVARQEIVERFDAVLNPGRRVPRYAAERAGRAPELFENLPPLDSVLDDLLDFLDDRPVVAQEASHAWSFVDAEARRVGRSVPQPLILDITALATLALDRRMKPSLAVAAQHVGVSFTHIEEPAEEARVIALVLPRLLDLASVTMLDALRNAGFSSGAALRRGSTARALPDQPGVYVMRDAQHAALYVGKARRLRERMAAYVHRPLGATRRLEGLADEVDGIESALCATDLEALVLEDREIRRLQPRFNTQRRQRAPRLWIRLPPQPATEPGRKRTRAPTRLELAIGSETSGGRYLGPFRNQATADHARWLARQVFDLDHLRPLADRKRYVESLEQAWAFLCGSTDAALGIARQRHARAVAAGDVPAARHWVRVLGAVRDYDLNQVLLPADPRVARYAVVRPAATGLEGLVLDRGILVNWRRLETLDLTDLDDFATRLLAPAAPRTESDDVDVVLRWFGGLRQPARLVHLSGTADHAHISAAAAALRSELSAAVDVDPE